MGQAQETRSDWFTGWRGVLVATAAMFAFLVALSSVVDQTRWTGLYGDNALGTPGFSIKPLPGQDALFTVIAVDPGGPAARSGVHAGDRFRPDQLYDFARDYKAGQSIGFTIVNGPHTRHVTLVFSPVHFGEQALSVRIAESGATFARWLSILFGGLLLVRGWGNRSALILGFGMVGISIYLQIPAWAEGPIETEAMVVASGLTLLAMFGYFLFPVVFYSEKVRSVGRTGRAIVAGIAALFVLQSIVREWGLVANHSHSMLITSGAARDLISLIAKIPGVYWSWRGWRETVGSDRVRFSTILLALLAGLLGNIIQAADLLNGTAILNAPPNLTHLLLLTVAPRLLLAYAVLRHRVVDLGFAFNRTLVYGTFSVILLGSFGLIEWAVEHLLPEEWVKASAWIDAGAAVVVYLAFHRVHDAVEQRVEHLFFGHWQANEDALRRFVASSSHFEDPRALARGFADELARFGGDARVALYRLHDGVLDSVAGNWDNAPRHFREDNPAFALMRAERAPLDLTETRTGLPGVLALPMLDHGALAGLVLMDLKNNAALYRPDEVALLGWAAHEVGLALAALQARATDAEVHRLKIQNAELRDLVGGWRERTGV